MHTAAKILVAFAMMIASVCCGSSAIGDTGGTCTWTTLAGLAGFWGSTDGTGSAARFSVPRGVAVDSTGNVYVADTDNNTIRMVTPLGVVTTLAGLAGYPGSTYGTGSDARFYWPSGVAVDSAGNVYVADSWNDMIRHVAPVWNGVDYEWLVWTLAGQVWNTGSADGTGMEAEFFHPWGVAVDSAGNVYVADTDNYTIRKVTPAGVVTTLAGLPGHQGSADGTGSAARFNRPVGVTVDRTGNVYVADTDNHTIRKITPVWNGIGHDWVVTTLAGLAGSWGSTDGMGSAARFYWPEGLAVDSTGNVYVADTYNNMIRKVAPSGVVTTLASMFSRPAGVAVDSEGNVYVADTGNDRILRTLSPIITTVSPLPDAIVGVAYKQTLAATGGVTPYTWSVSSGSPPTGLSLDSGRGIIIGTPTAQTTTSFTVQVTGNDGTSSTVDFSLTVCGFQGSPSPFDNQMDVPLGTSLSWTGGGAGTTFDVYLDVVKPPNAMVANGISTSSFAPLLAEGTWYYWKVVAMTPAGMLEGPVWTFATHLAGDIDGDGAVILADLKLLVAAWNTSPGNGRWNAAADIDADNTVNLSDLKLLVTNWSRSAN